MPESDQKALEMANPTLFGTGEISTGRVGLLGTLGANELDRLVTKGEAPINPDRLSPSQRESLSFGISGDEGAQNAKFDPPGFYITWNQDFVGPVLWIRNGRGQATHVVGGRLRDVGLIQNQGDGWTCGFDPEPFELRQRMSSGDPLIGAATNDRSIAALLKRAATEQGLLVMADLVYRRGNSPGWMGRTPKLTIHGLVARRWLVCKERAGIWLLRDPITMVHPRKHLVPWQEIRELRTTARDNGGNITLEALTRMCDATPEQLEGLSEEFPSLTPEGLLPWRPILRFHNELSVNARAKLTRDEGLPLRDSGLVDRAALSELPDAGEIRGLAFIQEHFSRAVVTLTFGTFPGVGDDGQKREARALMWIVRVPGFPERRRQLPLAPRKPLEPTEAPLNK